VPHASLTIDAIRQFRAEPKCSAAFAYLDNQAQVLHFVPFQSVVLPRRPSLFFNGRKGPTRAAMKRRHRMRGALMAPLNQAETLVCRCLLRCSTLEKIKTRLTCSSTLRPKCRHHLLAFFNQASQVSSLLQIGKFQGYSFRQTFCQPKSFLIFSRKQIP
jgi:hypothetical protein